MEEVRSALTREGFALAARIPDAARLIVPGAGHMVPITHPDLVARAVQAHLETA